jgi:pimeloyl-ACP methyl ester carboxylesterase
MGALMGGLREQAILLGKRKSLVGIVAQGSTGDSAAGDSDSRLPAVVILNSGIIHRVGPNRMFVRLSRQLAVAGHLVVRFDLSGIGDSEPRADGLSPLDATLADIREVLDSLEATRQVRRFILVGLCSGADHSVVYAGQDPRVAGMVLIDPTIPRTRGYYVRHYRGRVLRWRSWLNFASGRHPFWKSLGRSIAPAAPESPEGEEELREALPDVQDARVRTFLADVYARAAAAGVDIMAVFTGGREDRHNEAIQLLEAFPQVAFGSRLRLEFMGSADHTFTSQADRCSVLALISSWIGEHSGALAPSADLSGAVMTAPPGQKSA